MQRFQTRFSPGRAIVLPAVAAASCLVGSLVWRATADEVSQPPSHAAVYRRLAARVSLDFVELPLSEMVARLAKATGVPIRYVAGNDPQAEKYDLDHKITARFSSDPASLEAALEHVTRQTRGESYGLYLDDEGARVAPRDEDQKEPVLETFRLHAPSDYTTRMRVHFIEEVRRLPDFAASRDVWIIPGRSIFTVDVYHRPAVQRQVRELWDSEFLKDRITGPAEFDARYDPLDPKKASREEILARANELRREFPFQSIAPRLTYERKAAGVKAPALARTVEIALAAQEKQDARTAQDGLDLRTESLRLLHSDYVEKFVSGPGFGETRTPTP
ncbi:MAG TPA: hypothetical protein VMF30_02130, partial [Pirellulales bacterium]|nr:hypothetical protein [Pirellulales bacterium]